MRGNGRLLHRAAIFRVFHLDLRGRDPSQSARVDEARACKALQVLIARVLRDGHLIFGTTGDCVGHFGVFIYGRWSIDTAKILLNEMRTLFIPGELV